MSELGKFIEKIKGGHNLSLAEAQELFEIIISGQAKNEEIARILLGLKEKGESAEEIAGAALALKAKSEKINAPESTKSRTVDTCGTGGDGANTLNISTAVAIITASCGVPVAKHGNRSVSSKSGSADVLRELGINIEAEKHVMEQALQEAGICFLFAPKFHSAMRHVAGVRKKLATRTIFNLIGPLTNPAGAKRQLIGVYEKGLTEKLAHVLRNLGTERAWVAHGADGLDEITITGRTYVCELANGSINNFEISPRDAGLDKSNIDEIKGGDPKYNASRIQELLNGKKDAYRNIVLFNTAAILVISEKAENLKEGAEIAAKAIDSGAASETLQKLIKITNIAAN